MEPARVMRDGPSHLGTQGAFIHCFSVPHTYSAYLPQRGSGDFVQRKPSPPASVSYRAFVWVSAWRISELENSFSRILLNIAIENARHREGCRHLLFLLYFFMSIIQGCLVTCLFPMLLTMGVSCSPLWSLSVIHLIAVSDVSAPWYSKSLV